ncbi:MAG: ABC transporter ATP-binding protein [bacterium]|nr:ABC transporter ATP-binding protein [bacterium]
MSSQSEIRNPKSEILEVEDLTTYFHLDEGIVRAVDEVSFTVDQGETLGIVGESGCGKSVTSLSIMRLIPTPPGRIEKGRIFFKGRDLLRLSEPEMRRIRGKEISMIFQEPVASLNPVFTVGSQISEAIRLHQGLSKGEAIEKAVEMLKLVGIPLPEERIRAYPHQLSGGMCQRVMIAMALSSHPSLLIADEPTTALDVTIQAQILELLTGLQRKLGMTIILITHDLGVIAETADRVMVMYAGWVVEHAPVLDIFEKPKHPYTLGLLRSMPRLGQTATRLPTIEGLVPNPAHLPSGCYFNPRCPYSSDLCRKEKPELRQVAEGHWIRCYKDI